MQAQPNKDKAEVKALLDHQKRAFRHMSADYTGRQHNPRQCLVLQFNRDGHWADERVWGIPQKDEAKLAYRKARTGRLIFRETLPDGFKSETVLGEPTLKHVYPKRVSSVAPVALPDMYRPDPIVPGTPAPLPPVKGIRALPEPKAVPSAFKGRIVNLASVLVDGAVWFVAFTQADAIGIAQALHEKRGIRAKVEAFGIPDAVQAFADKRVSALSANAKASNKKWELALEGRHFDGQLPSRILPDGTVQEGEWCGCPACKGLGYDIAMAIFEAAYRPERLARASAERIGRDLADALVEALYP